MNVATIDNGAKGKWVSKAIADTIANAQRLR
jgi:hypothetical protein